MPSPADRLTDQQLFEFLQNVPAGILVVDAKGYVTYANAAWEAIFGPEAAARITKSPLTDFYDVYIARTNERYPREKSPIFCAFKGETTRAQDIEVRFPDRTLFLDIAAAPIRDDEGKVVYAIANVIDITDRARVEDAYRDLFENAPMGIYRATAAGDVLLANPALLEMLGFDSVEDMKGWNLDRERQHTSSDRPTFKRLLEEEGRVRGIETLLTKRDGNFIRVSESARAIRDNRNRVLFYEGTVEDITQRKNIEQELRRSREEYRYLIEKATDIIYRVDAKGIFRYVNPTVVKVLGYPEEEIVGKHFTDLIDPQYRAAALEFYRQAFLKKEPNTYYEFPCIAKNGDRVWVGQNVQPILTGEWVLGFQAVARDISQRKEMESALARARDTALESARVKSEFLANMSHEIRTPLNGVVGMSDLLLRMTLTPEQRDAAQTIRSSAEALLTLVDDILDLSKIEAGKLEIAATDFDLDELVDTVTDMFAERAAAKGLKLRAIIYPDVERHLVGDAMRVRQVLINLVGNAVKFTDQGEVSLSVMQGEAEDPDKPESVTLWFMVNDTGIGMSDAQQSRIFTPFMQADGSTTRRFGGTGLGLAISKQLVDMMSGRIGVASVPDEGSTFWFTAPFLIDRGAELQVKKTALTGVRALIVDSDEVNRLMLRRHLVSLSMTADEAPPSEVVATLRRAAESGTPFDVVVLEMQLDDTDGISVTREIHADPVVGSTPIVLVTAIGRRKTDAEFFIAERVDIWVMKPVRRAQLGAAIAQVVRREEAPQPEPSAETEAKPAARILVVEDNIINQKVAIGQLRLLGYEPEVLSSGSAAIEAVRRNHFDLILLDCQMPEMDGYDVAVAIRRMQDKTRRTPIIAMTAHTGDGEREKSLASGMDDFVTKPVSTQRLGSVLARWLGRREPDIVDAAKVAGLQLLARQNPMFMRDITGLFREDALIRLHELRDACASSNADALARAAHALKSSSGNIGASRMYSLCAALESSAKKGEIESAADLVAQLTEELDRAMAALTEA